MDFDSLFNRKSKEVYIFALLLLTVVLGIYILNLMFGNRSLSQMIELQTTEKILQDKVKEIKRENEKLQKEYFELKELEG